MDYPSSILGAQATVVISNASHVSETHNLVLDSAGTYTFQTALGEIAPPWLRPPAILRRLCL